MSRLLEPPSPNCRLPCWWGFTPGKSNWESAAILLRSFSEVELLGYLRDGEIYEVIIPALQAKGLYSHHFYATRANLIESIEVPDPGDAPDFTIKALLAEFGQPDQIWLRTYSKPYLNKLPFGLALFYPARGVVAAYYGDARLQQDEVVICLGQVSHPYLGMWDSRQAWDFEQAALRFNWDTASWAFLELEKSTGVSIDELTNAVQTESKDYCLKTPAINWQPAQ